MVAQKWFPSRGAASVMQEPRVAQTQNLSHNFPHAKKGMKSQNLPREDDEERCESAYLALLWTCGILQSLACEEGAQVELASCLHGGCWLATICWSHECAA